MFILFLYCIILFSKLTVPVSSQLISLSNVERVNAVSYHVVFYIDHLYSKQNMKLINK